MMCMQSVFWFFPWLLRLAGGSFPNIILHALTHSLTCAGILETELEQARTAGDDAKSALTALSRDHATLRGQTELLQRNER